MRYLLSIVFVMGTICTAFGSQDVINSVVFEDSIVSDELGNQYNSTMMYPSGSLTDGISLNIVQTNHVPPRTRYAITTPGIILPINEPGIDDTIPAFYVHGDVCIGDILQIGRAPLRNFKRAELDLPASAVTTMYSANQAAKDLNGGAFIQMSPYDQFAWNDGYINLTAYGTGNGVLANSVFLRARKDFDTVEEIAVFSGRNNIYPGQTCMSLRTNADGVLRFQRVYVGAPNSGGPGRRVLTIDN